MARTAQATWATALWVRRTVPQPNRPRRRLAMKEAPRSRDTVKRHDLFWSDRFRAACGRFARHHGANLAHRYRGDETRLPGRHARLLPQMASELLGWQERDHFVLFSIAAELRSTTSLRDLREERIDLNICFRLGCGLRIAQILSHAQSVFSRKGRVAGDRRRGESRRCSGGP
jgi:hypothetical protein